MVGRGCTHHIHRSTSPSTPPIHTTDHRHRSNQSPPPVPPVPSATASSSTTTLDVISIWCLCLCVAHRVIYLCRSPVHGVRMLIHDEYRLDRGCFEPRARGAVARGAVTDPVLRPVPFMFSCPPNSTCRAIYVNSPVGFAGRPRWLCLAVTA